MTVGGSGVGDALLHRVMDAVPLARRMLPALRFLVVTGPADRSGVAAAPARGDACAGSCPTSTSTLAACDVAIVQGGLTTCMELAAAQRPFLYVPLENHFEQNFHVRHRLEQLRRRALHPLCRGERSRGARRGARRGGRRARCDYRPVETDGAARAAAMLAELI